MRYKSILREMWFGALVIQCRRIILHKVLAQQLVLQIQNPQDNRASRWQIQDLKPGVLLNTLMSLYYTVLASSLLAEGWTCSYKG